MENRKDNYSLSRDRAQELFLRYDQETIVHLWNLQCDSRYLYVTFFGQPYQICRKTGTVTDSTGTQAGFNAVLTIFDLLSHPGQKQLAGRYAPVNSLNGRPVAAGVETKFFTESAKYVHNHPDAFRCACRDLGGEAVAMGDIGYRFPVFGELTLIVKFYFGDEDFPPSLLCLWDQNTLQYLLYETVFYAEGFLLNAITSRMHNEEAKL